ncbi:MAG: carbonic anhydrase [Acidimicrobiia bacterium]
MTDAGFDDILAANSDYAETFRLSGLSPQAARGLGVVTCIDSRIEPLAMLGLVPGDSKIIRNAGARVTDDALRSLVLAVHLLSVSRIAVIQHTRCRMTGATNDEIRDEIAHRSGASTDGWNFRPIADQHDTLVADIALIRTCPLIPDAIPLAGMIYDVDTGLLHIETTA